MKKFLSVILAAAMAFLSACDSTPQQRGVSGRAYISSSRPAIRVEAGELPVVTSGLGHGRIYNTGNASGLPLDTRAVVWGTDAEHPMAVLIHAELPDSWDWTSVQSRTGSIHFETERLGGQEFAAYTYLVPADKDPFAGLVGDPRKGTHWVARYYARRYNNNRGKIILEYREPAPEKITALSGLDAPERAWLDSFRDRARKFFIIAVPEKPHPQIEKGFAKDVRWQFLNDSILGPVFLKN